MSKVEPKEPRTTLQDVLSKINKILIEETVTARDILHIATELNANAMLSLMYANIIQNQMSQAQRMKDERKVTKKDKGPGKS